MQSNREDKPIQKATYGKVESWVRKAEEFYQFQCRIQQMFSEFETMWDDHLYWAVIAQHLIE